MSVTKVHADLRTLQKVVIKLDENPKTPIEFMSRFTFEFDRG